jgi:hypothetical protein
MECIPAIVKPEVVTDKCIVRSNHPARDHADCLPGTAGYGDPNRFAEADGNHASYFGHHSDLSWGAYGEEEAYLSTSRLLGACMGSETRQFVAPGSRVISPDAVDALPQRKCGYLEEKQEKEFFDYIQRQLSRTLTFEEQAETAMRIVSELLASHTRGGLRRPLVEAYKSAVTKRK